MGVAMDCVGDDDREYISEWPPPPLPPPQEEDKSFPDETFPKAAAECDHPAAPVAHRHGGVMTTADAMVSRWWRTRSVSSSFGKTSKAVGCNKTQLEAVKATPEARAFMQEKALELEAAVESPDGCRDPVGTLMTLAALHLELGNLEEASRRIASVFSPFESLLLPCQGTARFLDRLSQLDEVRREAAWLSEKLRLVREARHPPPRPFKVANSSSSNRLVDRVPCQDLSVEAFRQNYCDRGRPVVITGVKVSDRTWDLDLVAKVAGKRRVMLKAAVARSTEWARLEPSVEMSVDEFVSAIEDGTAGANYLFDWSLPLFCPELLEHFRVPDYFADDYLKATPPHALYRNSWPSLFVSPAGTVSDLHVDAFGSNFWMFLFRGAKRWTFFAPEALPHLRPRYFGDSLDPVFDATEEDFAHLDPFVCDLGPEELLFVPAGSPHRVVNLEASIAVSGNFVNSSNAESVVRHLKCNALKDDRSADLLRHLLELKLINK